LEADEEVDDEDYIDDEFEEILSHKTERSGDITNPYQIKSETPPRTEVAKVPFNAGAAIVVTPVQQKNGIIGNLEYGMRSKSPAMMKGNTHSNTKPPSKPNVDLMEVVGERKRRSQNKVSATSKTI